MAVEHNWPTREDAQVIGKDQSRLDGLKKATGTAKYTYDINLKKQLICKALGNPMGSCRVTALDTAAAEKVPGVVHVEVLRGAGTNVEWEGELLAVVAAETEAAAVEGRQKLADALQVEAADVFVTDEDLEQAVQLKRTGKGGGESVTVREPGDDDDEDEFVEQELTRLFKQCKYVVDGYYGIDVISHCCLEPHGSTLGWDEDRLVVNLSTQNVSRTDDGFADALEITADDVDVRCDFVGGGFGSKFNPDYWGIAAAKISKKTGRPVKFMLDRDQELKLGGNRPSGYIKVKLGADENGIVQVWDSEHWGTGGRTGGAVRFSVIPYVLRPKNYRTKGTNVFTNTGGARAWRAPSHPQACAMSQTAYDDLAREMGADSLEIFLKNIDNLASRQTPEVYKEEMKIAAELMQWKEKWHPHGKGDARGSIVDGLGMACHEWGGGANASNCQLKIHPDGGVESFCGTQDIGTGTRTVCAMVLAETFGLTVEDVKVNIGSSKYPFSGASGGSTTVGAVCESHRQAAQNALAKLFELAAPGLKSDPSELEAVGGRIRRKGDADKSIGWKQACSLLQIKPLEVTAEHPRGPGKLSGNGVGGVQMAHVEVDKETGVVKVKKFVAVQDQGLVINPKTCKSQIYGAIIMGIAYSLYEHRIMDPKTGAYVNAEMADYKLARLGDIGEIVVHLYETDEQRARGVIGNGEPPVISPGAAISNAVCNALGVRVPVLPMTPQRVLKALQA